MNAYSAKVALLGNLVDYAGTFPPAALTLEKALVEVSAFRRRAKHPWLLAKIVVTIADLKKLSPRLWFESGADGTPCPLTVIGSPVEKVEDLERNLGFELRELRRFNEKFTESSLRQRAFAYETKLPEDCPTDSIVPVLRAALATASMGNGLDLDVYFEVPLTGDWQTRLARATRAMSDWNEEDKGTGCAALKVRTGGKVTPSPEQLAEVIAACVTQGLRFKATQGLHHPISRDGDYGFVNLFGALAFAHALGLEAFGVSEIKACLVADDAAAFSFSSQGFTWKQFTLSAEEIESARRRHTGTFGSCSIAEPDEFLANEMEKEKR